MKRTWRFLREVRAELSKVVWPTRARTAKLTVIVVIVTAVLGGFIAAVDYGLGKGIKYVLDEQATETAPPAAAPQTQEVPVVPPPTDQSQPTQ